MMRIATTGPRGRLGSALTAQGAEPVAEDIREREAIARAVAGVDVLINAAAFTDVDGAEEPEKEDEAVTVNTRGPGVLRTSFDGLLVQVSTGYIFDGAEGPYAEDAIPSPVNFYGMTKLGGEAAALVRQPTLVVRTLDLFGSGPRSDFVRRTRDLFLLQQPVEVPTNQNLTPTFLPYLAKALMWIAEQWPLRWHTFKEKIGGRDILNVAGSSCMSRFDWCRMIAEVCGYDPSLVVPTDRRWGRATRPLRGGLLTDRAQQAGVPIFSAREGLLALLEAEHAVDET